MKCGDNKLLESKSKQISSSDDEDNGKKILLESIKYLEQTQSLRMANSQLLHADDYVRLSPKTFLSENETVVENVRCSKLLIGTKKKSKSSTKGFCSYVLFVFSYLILLFIVTFFLTNFGKI